MNLDYLLWAIWLIAFGKVCIIGDFSFFSWIRYGREYRIWHSSRESFGEYLVRNGKKKSW